MRTFLIAILCCLCGSLAGAQDVLYLKTGESLACQVDALTDNIVNFSLLTNAGTTTSNSILKRAKPPFFRNVAKRPKPSSKAGGSFICLTFIVRDPAPLPTGIP
jgi:hypothetical protein